MTITYKLFKKGKGFVVTRKPQLISEKLHIYFEGAPPDATAIFTSDETQYYRKLTDNMCVIPDGINGQVSVSVAIIDGKTESQKWHCEGLICKKQENGVLLVSPDDMNIPEKFIEIMLEFEESKANILSLEKKNIELEKRLSEMETVHKKAIKELHQLINKNKYI